MVSPCSDRERFRPCERIPQAKIVPGSMSSRFRPAGRMEKPKMDTPHIENSISAKATGGRAPTRSESCRKGWCLCNEYL